MKKTKRLLSMLTALAITASAFASIVIPASAEVTPTTQNFDALEETPWVIPDISSTLTVDGTNKYVSFRHVSGKNSRAASYSFATVDAGEDYAVEFDMRAYAHGDNTAVFAVEGTDSAYANKAVNDGVASGYVFKMEADNSTTWRLNGDKTDTVVLDNTKWYHYTVAVKGGIAYLTIADKSAEEGSQTVLDQHKLTVNGAGGMKALYWRNGRAASEMDIDNLELRALKQNEVPDNQYYSVKLNTTRYATVKYTRSDMGTDEKTAYADENGNVEITLVESGSTFKYTISKTGYTSSEEATVTVDANKEIDCALTPTAEISDYIYYESDFGNANKAVSLTKDDRVAVVSLGNMELPDISEISFDVNIPQEERTQVSIAFFNGDASGICSANDVFGIQGNSGGLFAVSGYNGTTKGEQEGWQQYNIVGKFDNIEKIADTYVGSYTIDMIVNRTAKSVSVKCGDRAAKVIPIPEGKDASILKFLKVAKHEKQSAVTVDNIIVKQPDQNYVAIKGASEFAKITGKTVTRDYSAEALVPAEGETFTWSVTKADGTEAGTGVSISQEGVLSVTDEATPDDYKVIAASTVGGTISSTKVGEFDVTIADVQNYTADVTYPLAVEKGQTAQLTVNKITDALGDDVTDYFNPTWSIDGATSDSAVEFTVADAKVGDKAWAISSVYNSEGVLTAVYPEEVTVTEAGKYTVDAPAGAKVYLWDSLAGMKPLSSEVKEAAAASTDTLAAISGKTGVLSTNAAAESGPVEVTLTIDGNNTEDYEIIVGNFSKVENYDAEKAAIAVDDLVADDAITGYLVTVADAEGNKLGEEVTDVDDIAEGAALPSTLVAGTPAKVEVTPIYALSSIPKTPVRGEFALPADTYNFTVTLATGSNRTDVYANDQLLVNNMFQYGSTPDKEIIHDIYVDDGRITVKTDDYGDGKSASDVNMTAFTAVKAPSIVTRKPKIYVLGDSLVCKYYNGDKTKDASADDQLKQTGWGQVLQNYITDDYEVVDIANSGVTAAGLASSAITQVVKSGKPGDILLLESGYNDKQHSNETEMKNALRKMISETPNGVDIILISPNASMHDFNDSVQYTSYMKDIADEQKTKYINLAKLSNDFLADRYDKTTFCKDGDPNTDGVQVNEMSKIWNVSDRLHSTLNAANKWASVVATELGKLGYSDLINTTYTYTFDDVLTLNDLAVDTTGTVTCQATVSAN